MRSTGAETWAVEAHALGKAYHPHATPAQRLRAALTRTAPAGGAFWALKDVSLRVARGEALGVVGRNGAGKSTLLQLLCGTLAPTTGSVKTNGRIAALLELGAGFNPEFSGRQNLMLNGPLLGLNRDELIARIPEIIEFSGIGDFVDQPVKTYSSGMFVRLAFSLATSVQPDILIVDEALSVGDGEFSRRSFERIKALRDHGTTILFCSHSLYQVEAFCDRVLWLNGGIARALGEPAGVIREYDLFLAGEQLAQQAAPVLPAADAPAPAPADAPAPEDRPTSTPGHARISRVRVLVDGQPGSEFTITPGTSTLRMEIAFESDPALPPPSAGMTIELPIGMALTCAVARTDGVTLDRDRNGRGVAIVEYPRLPLRKGKYRISAYLGHEDAVRIYDAVEALATLNVEDALPEPGLVNLPHHWTTSQGSDWKA
jgi:lipopolysaccharide transport system ATP-binding protein